MIYKTLLNMVYESDNIEILKYLVSLNNIDVTVKNKDIFRK